MRPAALWQLAITTAPETEEALREALESHFHAPATSYVDVLRGRCVVSVFLPQRPKLRPHLVAVRAVLTRLSAAGLDTGRRVVKVRKLAPQDWAQSWKRHFKPLALGSRLLVKPSWSRRAPRCGQAVVVLDPGLSFGTGHHATTAFCLRQVIAFRRLDQAQSILDIGTGSGILAIAAVKLGYAPVEAFDYDPDAVRVADENARANGVRDNMALAQRDVTRLARGRAKKFDLVCANLLGDLLVAARPQIVARVAPGGRLVIAGILRREFDAVARCYTAAGWRLVASRVEKEWRSGAFERAGGRLAQVPFRAVRRRPTGTRS
jgi:ribosomal protein L11 methyltransferase